MVLSFSEAELENSSASEGFGFNSASLSFRDLFGQSIRLAFFVGENDTFGSGDIFSEIFGAAQVASRYRGIEYFPDIPFPNEPYDGIHRIAGTGARIEIPFAANAVTAMAYVYQDSRIVDADGEFEPGHYSGDLRAVLNFERLKMESFLGATFPAPGARFGYYRGGLMLFAFDQGVEFFAQIGIPLWNPAESLSLPLSMFYLLFEPRVDMGNFSVVPTFFWRPQAYLQSSTDSEEAADAEEAFDVNLNFIFGDLGLSRSSGGIEGNLSFGSQIKVVISPYFTFITPGVLWKFKVNATLWPYSLTELIETYIGIQAEF